MQYNFDDTRRNEERQMHVFIAIILALLTVMTVITAVIICLPAPSASVSGNPSDTAGGNNIPGGRFPSVGNFANAATMDGSNIYVNDSTELLSDSNITSENLIVVDMANNIALYSKKSDERIQIASMTKVMTLITALELLESNNQMYIQVEIKKVYGNTDLTGYQKAFKAGEKAYVIDLLYSLILQSGCDSALALAEVCAGGEEQFVAEMNKMADKMGLENTHFTNCYGADDGGENYSTVREVGEMLLYALKNELAYKIITTPSNTYLYYGKYQIALYCQSMVLDRIGNYDVGDMKVLGGKSGNDTMAGYCLVSFAEGDDGHRYLVCTAGHKSSSYNDSAYIYKNYTN